MTDATPPLADDLKALELIVRRLESEDLDLDTALALFEEGVQRLRRSREQLQAAELKVVQVLEEADGELRTGPLES